MEANHWTVRLPARLRPIVEQVGREEYRQPADTVRWLIERALADRALTTRSR
jgi:hypothetical protein